MAMIRSLLILLPGFYPKEYAEVLLVSDSIAWFDEPVESLNQLQIKEEVTFQLLLRAVLFRLSVPLFFDSGEFRRLLRKNTIALRA